LQDRSDRFYLRPGEDDDAMSDEFVAEVFMRLQALGAIWPSTDEGGPS
jgi:hypothetical protein